MKKTLSLVVGLLLIAFINSSVPLSTSAIGNSSDGQIKLLNHGAEY